MFPEELKQFPQWVIWKNVAKPDGGYTKLPYSALNGGGMASVTDWKTWSTFAQAVQAAQRQMCGIGFVLTDKDPYAFIDLDDPHGDASVISRQQKIEETFQTYSELSPSGKGLHIICRGEVPRGRRRDKVEVYSTQRFMTMTGETYRNTVIADRKDLLRTLWDEIGGSPETETEVHDQSQKYDDTVIHSMAVQAVNGEKFNHLWNGEYLQAGYKSQSEADFALIDMLGFYSRNSDQIKRMFLQSALGQRDKALRKNYIETMIRRSFDNQPPFVDLSEIIKKAEATLEVKSNHSNPFAGPLFEHVPDETYDYTLPPGLLGEIASFIYDASPRQVREIALAASIGMMAGIAGRSYNVSSTGLNQYVLLLAKTGTGKEGMVSGIDRILGEVGKNVPAALDFIGPSSIASGQALIRHISVKPCFVSIVGEFGLALQAMCAFNANGNQILLRKQLLELYSKSGKDEVLRSTIYADKDKNTPIVGSPAFSILGESTPASYYGGIDETMIAQGLLPRFLCIEYGGKVPYLNKNHRLVRPSPQLIERVSELTVNCLTMMNNHAVIDVVVDPDAQKFSDEFGRETTNAINQNDMQVIQELWNRAHLKMIKLAALLAVGTNFYSPVITIEMMKWSHNVIDRDIKKVLARFEAGNVGADNNETVQTDKLVGVIRDYIVIAYGQQFAKYNVPERMHADRVIPWSYMQRRLLSSPQFRTDRIGASNALKRAIDSLIAEDAIRELRQTDLHNRYGCVMKSYYIINPSRFTDKPLFQKS